MTIQLDTHISTMAEEVTPRRAQAARRAITAAFAINGLLVATYLVRIPSLQTSLGLTDSQLGAILTCWGVTALVAMQLVGGLVARFGSVRIIRLTLAALPFSIFGIGLAGTPLHLAVSVAVGGALVGTLDTAMNAHAVVVERHLGKPILSSCHAAVSGSAIVASLLSAAAINAGLSMATQTLYLGTILLIVGAAVCVRLLPATADQDTTYRPRGGLRRWGMGWTSQILILGLLGMALMLCEATVIVWGGVFLHSERGADLALAALGYGTFTLFQTLGRIAGDVLTRRVGRSRVFRMHAIIAVIGVLIVLSGSSPLVSLIGFAVTGLGTSVLVPLVFSTVGQAGGNGPGAAVFVSRATTFVYAGILIGPAATGWLGKAIGLPLTFACLIPLLAGAVAAANVTRGGPSVGDQ